MFYCDYCAKDRNWPITAFKWRSVCEKCGYLAVCSDIPSTVLNQITDCQTLASKPLKELK
jgi:hypothetical protein